MVLGTKAESIEMLKKLIAFSLKNAALVVLLSCVLLGVTWYGLKSIPVDVFPELNAPTVTLMTESGGLTAEEVEQYISFPIESAVNGVPGLRRVRSSSSLGLSIVWAEFNWGTDIYLARQMIGERLATVSEELPEEAHMQMAPISSVTGEIMLISLQGDKKIVSPMEVRAYAEFDLRNRLLTVSGISQVVAIGGHLPEFQVEVKQEALVSFGLTTEIIAEAIGEAHNLNTAGFLVNYQGLELPMRQSGRVKNISDIEETVVIFEKGTPIKVKDVASVKLGGAFRRGAASDNGESAVVLSIQKAPGTNTLEITKSIDLLLDQVDKSLPDGISLNRNVMRQADFINRSVDNVVSTLYEATAIVTIILILFLMNIRTTVITLIALPMSLGVTLIIMWGMGMSINVMTLGGLAVAIGILVDDAIIDVENVYRRLGENAGLKAKRPRMRVIYDASNEIRSSVVFATIIICIVFVPLLFLDGLEGRFFKPLGLTYIISVMVSLLVAMTLTPALCWYLLKGKIDQEHSDSKLVSYLKSGYRPLLNTCLNWKKTTLAFSALLTFLAISLASTFGSSFLPKFNEGTYTVFLMMPPGTSLEESERIALGVQKRLIEIEGIEHAVGRSGRAERDEHAEPPSNTEIELTLLDTADPSKVLSEIDVVLAGLPGVTTNIGQPISHRLSHVMSGAKAQIAINVFGEDLALLRKLAKDIEAALKATEGTRDVAANREVMVKTLAIDFRLQDLARYGLTSKEAGAQVKRSLFGDSVSVINQGVRRYDLVLRLVENQRTSIKNIEDVILTGKSGTLVRLKEVANIGPEQQSNLISRQNAQRKTLISLNVADGYNLGDTISAIQKVVDPIVHKEGYLVEYGGQFQAQQSAMKTILSMGAIVLIAMVMLLQMALGSIRPALLVMLNLPLAVIGGIVTMFLVESDNSFANLLSLFGIGERYVAPVVSISSMVGFITLFGIAVRNGILLVNHYHWLIKNDGLDLIQAIRRGSEERLVPVLMTAISAALGLVPMAMKMGEPGSELIAPLAVVILGGLTTATFLNMLVVPVGYSIFCKPRTEAQKDPDYDPLTE
jgi:CzcA family heavy metal efflux pump